MIIASNALSSPDTIYVSGTGKPLISSISVIPALVNFGGVFIRSFKNSTFTLNSTGNDTIRIDRITSTDSVFSAMPVVGVILPSQVIIDTIRFAPLSEGFFEADLIIASNAPSPPDTIQVTGTGTLSPVRLILMMSLMSSSVRYSLAITYEDTYLSLLTFFIVISIGE